MENYVARDIILNNRREDLLELFYKQEVSGNPCDILDFNLARKFLNEMKNYLETHIMPEEKRISFEKKIKSIESMLQEIVDLKEEMKS